MNKNLPWQRYVIAVCFSLIAATIACNAPSGGVAEVTVTPSEAAASPVPATTIPTAEGGATPAPPTATLPAGVTPSATTCLYNAVWVADVTIPDNTEIVTGTAFTKTWRIKNNGCQSWPAGTVLIFVDGNQMGGPISVSVPATAVGGTQDISVALTAPATAGDYTGRWQLRSPDGIQFGDKVWVKIKAVAPTAVPPTAVPPTAVPTTVGLTLIPGLTLLPLINVDFTAGYAGAWNCGGGGSYDRISFQIHNTGNAALESMQYSVEGPVGTYLNGAMQNAPFRSSPSAAQPACMQAGSESLAAGASNWVWMVVPYPGASVGGRATIKICSQNDLGGVCKTVTVDFTF